MAMQVDMRSTEATVDRAPATRTKTTEGGRTADGVIVITNSVAAMTMSVPGGTALQTKYHHGLVMKKPNIDVTATANLPVIAAWVRKITPAPTKESLKILTIA